MRPSRNEGAARLLMALAQRAEDAVDRIDSWGALHAWYGRFGDCQDGSVGEGTSDATERLMVDQWDRLPVLLSLARSDPAFGRFVLAQFGEVTTMSAAEAIRANASKRCIPDAKAFCADLIKALAL